MADDRHRYPRATQPPAPLPRPRSLDEALDRLQSLETWMALHSQEIKARLDAGAAAMGEFKATLSELRPKRAAWIALAGPVIGVLSIVFTAGGYPDRAEFDRAEERGEVRVEKVRETIGSLEREQVRARSVIESLQKEIGELRARLDQAMQARRERERSR